MFTLILLEILEIHGLSRENSSNPDGYKSPHEYSIPYETNMILCQDGVSIHSWLLYQPKSKTESVPTILFFHGNAGNIGMRLPNAVKLYRIVKCNIFLVEYRGYGESDKSKPSEKKIKLDSETAYHYIIQHPLVDPSKLFIFGRSLGGAVAFHLSSYIESHSYPLAGLMVENTFLSISKMVNKLLPIFKYVKFLVLRIHWENEKIAPLLNCPILYLAGEKDELVPYEHMKILMQKSDRGKSKLVQKHIIKSGMHNDCWMKGGEKYHDAIVSFVEKCNQLSVEIKEEKEKFSDNITKYHKAGEIMKKQN